MAIVALAFYIETETYTDSSLSQIEMHCQNSD